MYGDCQVMSTMAGSSNNSNSVISPDSLFSNPSFGFMGNMTFNPFSSLVPKEEGGGGMMMIRSKLEEELSGSGSGGHLDGMSCGEEDDKDDVAQRGNGPDGKRKRYHRHTAHQIQEMEALFKECPHPDDKQRLKLSQDLGLKPRQVKFWFQNRRTQMKAQQDRADNALLRAENESLKHDNYRLQSALRNLICLNCGGPGIVGEMSYDEQQVRIENARLKEELERMSCLLSRYTGNVPMQSLGPTQSLMMPSLELDMNTYSRHFNNQQQAMGVCNNIAPVQNSVLIMDRSKGLALELAITATEHLVKLCTMNEPLWIKRNGEIVNEVLDYEEYKRLFNWPVELKQHNEGVRIEATRDSSIVMMNSITLIDAFFDVNKWVALFPTIVSKAKTLQIITDGISGHGNGSLHLMFAEFQVLSPLVPTREAYFLRYCQQNVDEGTWLIVDFPVDGFHDGLEISMTRYRRRPSGCIIQDMPNGYARVTWVEHADVVDNQVHQIFDKVVNCGVAFGATRWLSLLQRQCERHASLMAQNIPDLGVIPSPEARKNMMNLSQRMIQTFCANISSSNNQSWTALSESSDDTVRVTTRKNTEPGQPNGVILTAVSTVWLPFSHSQVFDLLSDEQKRTQFDALSYGNSLHEVAHIANGSHQRNCVSLMRINAASNSSQNVELLLQESSTHDLGGSIVVYATIDVDAVQIAMSGEDPSYVPLLPTGFVVLPAAPSPNKSSDGTDAGSPASTSGCLLTVGMQVLASSIPTAKLNLSSVTSINTQLNSAVQQITSALINNSNNCCNNSTNSSSNNDDDGLDA